MFWDYFIKRKTPGKPNVIKLIVPVIPSQCAHWRGNPHLKKEIATTSLRTGFAMTANIMTLCYMTGDVLLHAVVCPQELCQSA